MHVWLKHYVQHRLVKPGDHPTVLATCITFMVSALWHGIYPVYFVCFFYMFVLIEVSKDFYKAGDKVGKLWPLSYRPVKLAMAYVCTLYNCAYFSIMWRLKTLGKVWTFWKATYCIPFATTFVLCFILKVTGFGKVPRPDSK